jgi:hypothetical protein
MINKYKEKIKHKNSKTVYQYDVKGSFIKEYSSVADAANINNLSIRCISRCCRNEINWYKKYIWSYKKLDINDLENIIDEINIIKYKHQDKNKKIVYRYDLNGNFIKKYESMLSASKESNIFFANISSCCNNKRLFSGEYIWSFKKLDVNDLENIINKINNSKRRPKYHVYQCNVYGNIIREYDSIASAAKKCNIGRDGISDCCNNKRQYYFGYTWKFKYN